jgi:hypothetical protein
VYRVENGKEIFRPFPKKKEKRAKNKRKRYFTKKKGIEKEYFK